MRITLWGTRGSVAAPGAENARYGGNTSCVEVRGADGTVLVLDAGTGIRRLGDALPHGTRRIDLLLTHLHMDHIQGLGFFAPLFEHAVEVHLWGPSVSRSALRQRLMRYLSPPLFPVHLRDLPDLVLHHVPIAQPFEIGEFRVTADLVCHPGTTVGYRVAARQGAFAYLSDHEPALGAPGFPLGARWTSGHDLVRNVDLLVHDAQYTRAEYESHVGWGHSAIDHALALAALAGARHLVTFHHDPAHPDDMLDRITAEAAAASPFAGTVTGGMEGGVFEV